MYRKQIGELFSVVSGYAVPDKPERYFAGASHPDRLQRLYVYRSGYDARLQKTVLADYPALAHYVSYLQAERWIADYVRQTPSMEWDLNRYSYGFADFLAALPVAEDVVSLARLESAVAQVFWARSAKALSAAELTTFQPETLFSLPLQLHPACQLLRLPAAAHAYLTAFRAGNPPAAMNMQEEYVCVVRHRNEVQRIELDALHMDLLENIVRYGTLEAACSATISVQPECEDRVSQALPDYWRMWLEYGMFESWRARRDSNPRPSD